MKGKQWGEIRIKKKKEIEKKWKIKYDEEYMKKNKNRI